MKIFIEAGAVVSTSTCGPCLGGYMGILAEGERCITPANRNFVGRIGACKVGSLSGKPGGGSGQRRDRENFFAGRTGNVGGVEKE